jgi:hypothetical protein
MSRAGRPSHTIRDELLKALVDARRAALQHGAAEQKQEHSHQGEPDAVREDIGRCSGAITDVLVDQRKHDGIRGCRSCTRAGCDSVRPMLDSRRQPRNRCGRD